MTKLPRERVGTVCALLVAGAMAGGCSAGGGAWVDTSGQTGEEIIGGTLAIAYPEAAYLDIDMTASGGWACSAVLIAPKVVLTAGHCVDGHTKWDVHVGANARTSTSGVTYDWNEHGATTVNPAHHDLGLVFLDSAITLAQYPTIARTPLADNSSVLNVGRINNGTLTNSLYGATTKVLSGAPYGYPYDYVSADVIEHGDSGGPDFASGTHSIVAVNSGAGGGTEVLARVDLLADWIAQQIASHGGTGGGTGSADAGAKDAAPADAGQDAAPADAGTDSAAPSCTGATETEPNGAWSSATALGTTALCGTLSSAADEDWFSIPFGPGAVSVELGGAGDAVLSAGFATGATCTPSMTSLRQIGMSSPTARTLCVRVISPSMTVQGYTLTRR